MEYYIISNNTKQGPFSIEELANKDISHDTMVWSLGYTTWKQAKDVPELSEMLSGLPPEIPKRQPMPKTWLIESIVVSTLCCLPFGILGIINATKIEEFYQNNQYDQAVYYSNQAKKWTLVGFFLYLGIILLYLIILIIALIIEK